MAQFHLKFLSFGCKFLDYDADGWPDLIVNNGHVQTRANKREANVAREQRKQLLHNSKRGDFTEITDEAQLGDLAHPVIGRGLATGDFNNDGRIDVLAMAQNAPVQLLRNQTAKNGSNFASFLLRGTKSNRDAIGARVSIETGGQKQNAWVLGGSSYLSSSDRRLYFGLEKAKTIDKMTIFWPSGQQEILKKLAANGFYTLTEGRGVSAQKRTK